MATGPAAAVAERTFSDRSGVAPTVWWTERDPARSVVHVTGDIDLDTGPQLREFLAGELNQLAQPAGELVLDTTDVAFCDSSGLQALVATLRRARLLGCRLVLVVSPTARFPRFLRLAGVEDLFEIVAAPEPPAAAGPPDARKGPPPVPPAQAPPLTRAP